MPFDADIARQIMVDSQVRPNDVTDPGVQDAMRRVAREAHCGPAAHLAYADAEVEYAPGRWLLRPRDVSKLLQAVRPRAGEKALAISAPYVAAVLDHIGLTVAKADALDVIAGSYDVIVCEGAVEETPKAWLDALAVGGRLAVIERRGAAGAAKLYIRSEADLGCRSVFDAAPPVLAGLEKRVSFAF